MSTILDALRKVEEEKRTQEADVRTRLLSTASSRFDFRTQRRSRMPLVIGGGLIALGAIFGAGMMVWRTSKPVAEDAAVTSTVATASAPQIASVTPQQPETPVQPSSKLAPVQPQVPNMPGQEPDIISHTADTVKPPPQVQITPNAPGLVLPKPPVNVPAPPIRQPSVAMSGSLGVGETAPQYGPWHAGNPQAAPIDNSIGRRGSASPRPGDAVQRSPFVNSSPYDRIVAPPSLPPPGAPRVVATPKAPVQRPPASDERRVKSPSAPALKNDTDQAVTRSRSAPSPASSQGDNVGAPPGASLSFLQWSTDPEKRVASIKIGTGPATLAHEGDSVEGMTIEKIRPDAVELRSGESRYLLKAR